MELILARNNCSATASEVTTFWRYRNLCIIIIIIIIIIVYVCNFSEVN